MADESQEGGEIMVAVKKRDSALMIKMTDGEKAEVARAARAMGLTMSTYARLILLSHARGKKVDE